MGVGCETKREQMSRAPKQDTKSETNNKTLYLDEPRQVLMKARAVTGFPTDGRYGLNIDTDDAKVAIGYSKLLQLSGNVLWKSHET